MAEHRITELPVHLTLDGHVFMSTLADFRNGAMAKLDVSPGVYSLAAVEDKFGEEGFLFKRAEFDLNRHKAEQKLWTRTGAYGLSGTYWDGDDDHPEHMRLLNEHFAVYLSRHHFSEGTLEHDENYETYFDEQCQIEECSYPCKRNEYYRIQVWKNSPFEAEKRPTFEKLGSYNNLPILFFVKREPAKDDETNENDYTLADVTLEKVEKETDPFIAWRVIGRGEDLGYAIQMDKLINTVGDQAGITIFNEALAFGNYLPCEDDELETEDVIYGEYLYKCKVEPCTCRLFNEDLPYARGKRYFKNKKRRN